MPEFTDPDRPRQHHRAPRTDAHTPSHRRQQHRQSQQAGPSPTRRPREARRRRWYNAALRIGESDIIHAIRFAPCPDGDERIATACHTGHDRADDSPDLIPIKFTPVSCKNCQRSPRAHADGEPYDPNQNQYVLHAEGMPLQPSWPPPREDETGQLWLL